MNTRNFRYISIHEMEMITQDILCDYGFSLHASEISAVPIEEMIEFHFQLDILWACIDHLDNEELVMAAIIPDKRQIVLNDTCKDLFAEKMGTMHFTLAHELGHWVLHTGGCAKDGCDNQYLQTKSPFYCRSFHKKPAIEIQADLFAGCLLMPEPLLIRLVKQYKWSGPIYMRHVYEIAAIFQVSISALKVRLEQLDLLHIHPDGTVYHSRETMQAEQLSFDL